MFETEDSPDGLRVSMSASLENIDEADARVSAWLARSDLPLDRFAVRILLREALLNAVTHGSGTDPRQTVLLEVALDQTGVTLTIEDSGPGFIWQDRDVSFDILGDGGRGLALMQMYSSEMTFNECGNRVVLRRDCDVPTACRCGTNED